MIWTRENTQMNPCPYDMDGHNTPFNKERDVIDSDLTVYGLEWVKEITDENTNISYLISTLVMDEHDIQVLLEDNGVVGFCSKFSSAGPPPSPPFDVSGPGINLLGKSPTEIAQANSIYTWGVWNGWLFPQSGTDRYWVNAADPGAGASVPGAGENVIDNDKSSESGTWDAADTTHWSATTGSAASGAHTITLGANTANLGTITQSYASAILAVVTFTLQHSGAGSVSGSVTFTTGTWTANGSLTEQAGSVFGSNSAWHLDCNSYQTLVTTATFNSPTNAGTHTVAGSLTGTTTMTWNQNGVTTILDGATQTLTGGTVSSPHSFGNMTFLTSTTLTITSNVGVGSYGTSVDAVLTFNMTGAIADGGSGLLRLESNNVNSLVATSMPTSFGGITFIYFPIVNNNLPASTWTTVGIIQIGNNSANKTTTLTGNVTVTATTIRMYNNGDNGCVTAQSSYAINLTATNTITYGNGSTTHSNTVTTGTTTLSATNGITVSSSCTLGSNSNYVLDINSSFTNAGTTHLPNSTGTCTFSGTTWTETAAITANGGLITWDKAGVQTLGSNATSFYSVTIANGTTLDTSAASSFGFTAANAVVVGGGATGVFTCRGSAISTKNFTISVGGTLNGTTATHTVSGDWQNLGTNTQNGTTAFSDAAHSISGNNTWKNFTISVATARIITFEASKTQTFNGNVTLAGGAGHVLSLVSSAPGTYWTFTMTAPAVKTSLTYLSVTDSDAHLSDAAYKPINPSSSSGSHTLAWFPTAGGNSGLFNATFSLLEDQ